MPPSGTAAHEPLDGREPGFSHPHHDLVCLVTRLTCPRGDALLESRHYTSRRTQMRRILPAVLSLSVVFAGCKAKEAMDKAAIAHDLNNHSIMDLAKDVLKDKYTPPADGKLTDSQVQMYLKVREHEKQIAQVAKDQLKQHADEAKKDGDKSISGMVEGFKAMGSAADFVTADIRAAKDLHYNTQEHLSVTGQIL